jgi:hypothetical protein
MVGEETIEREEGSNDSGIDDIKSAVGWAGASQDSSSGQSTEREFNPNSQYVGEAPGPGDAPYPGEDINRSQGVSPADGEYSGMQPSLLGAPQEDSQQDGEYVQPQMQNQQMGSATYPPGLDYQSGMGNYATDAYTAEAQQQYQPYQEAMSSDIITEISEQVVTEKLSAMQDKLEKALDFRTVADTKITSLNERLRRIEQILDRLQLSILQKVGDYTNDVRDIKHELLETQKSFKALAPGMKRSKSMKGKSSGIVP